MDEWIPELLQFIACLASSVVVAWWSYLLIAASVDFFAVPIGIWGQVLRDLAGYGSAW